MMSVPIAAPYPMHSPAAVPSPSSMPTAIQSPHAIRHSQPLPDNAPIPFQPFNQAPTDKFAPPPPSATMPPPSHAMTSPITSAPPTPSHPLHAYQPPPSPATQQPLYSPATNGVHDVQHQLQSLQLQLGPGGVSAPVTPTRFSSVPISSPMHANTTDVTSVYDSTDPTVAQTAEYFSSYCVPNDKDVANNSPLPMGFLISPSIHLSSPPPRFSLPVQTCADCGGVVNLYCRVMNGPSGLIWRCVFCHTNNPFKQAHLYSPPSQLDSEAQTQYSGVYEFSHRVLESVDGHGQPIMQPTVFPASAQGMNSQPRGSGSGQNFIFLLDRNFSKDQYPALRRSLSSLLRDLPHDAGIMLVTFDANIYFYELNVNNGSAAIANSMSGAESPSQEDMSEMIKAQGMYPPTIAEASDVLLDTLEALEQCAPEFDEQRLFNPRCIGAAVEAAMLFVKHGRIQSQKKQDSAAQDAAVNGVTRQLSTGYEYTNIIVCTSGPPDFGPGETTLEVDTPENADSLVFYTELGNQTRMMNVTIDMFCIGMGHFAVPIVRKLVQPSGGSVYIHKQFDDRFTQDLKLTLFRPIGYDGYLDIYYTPALRITRVIGSVSSLKEGDEKDKHAHKHSGDQAIVKPAHLRLQLAACRPDQAITIMYALKDHLPMDYVYFQCILTYTDWRKQRITRVLTRRLRTTGNYTTFVRSIDVKVVSVLLVKRLVLLATHGQDMDSIQQDIDGQVYDTCKHFGREGKVNVPDESGGSSAVTVYELPSELNMLPAFLFHVRRGPLLGPILQHPDDIDVIRQILLHANRTDSLRLCMPTLLSFNQSGQFEELPLETLALQSNRILFLDHHTQILIWSGVDVTHPMYNPYREACINRAHAESKYRLPAPEVLVFNENSSAARFLQCRLIPSHKDSAQWQFVTFPQLQQLSGEQRQALIDKFLPTDEISFVQYYHRLFKQHGK